MKINFSKTVLTDIDGNPVKDSEGKPVPTDYKFLANAIFGASYDQIGIANLDKLEIAQKINRGEAIDLETKEQELLKNFINRLQGANGYHATAWAKEFENEKDKVRKD